MLNASQVRTNRDHDHGRVRVAVRDCRHDGRVDDAQPRDAVDAQLGVDDRVVAAAVSTSTWSAVVCC
jgi:hypothetical protein